MGRWRRGETCRWPTCGRRLRVSRPWSRLALPLKALLERFAFATLIVISVALLLVGKADEALMRALGSRVGDAMVPVLAVVAEPIAASRRVAAQIGALFALRQENLRLRDQNRRLLMWQDTARQLALENAALRQAAQSRCRGRATDHGRGSGGRGCERAVRAYGAGRCRRPPWRGQGHGGGQRARPGRSGDRGRPAQRPRAVADRFQLARAGDGGAVPRPGDSRRRQLRASRA